MKLGNKELTIGILIVILLFSFMLFGFTGFKVIGAALLLFVLPFYLILDNFEFELGEKIVFSFFLGIGLFSTIVYYLGLMFGSIKIATIVTFVLLVAIGLGLKKFFPAKKHSSENKD